MAFCDWWRIRNETTNKRRQQEQELREVEALISSFSPSPQSQWVGACVRSL